MINLCVIRNKIDTFFCEHSIFNNLVLNILITLHRKNTMKLQYEGVKLSQIGSRKCRKYLYK